jgi:SAM-dependent methyltransferase
MSKGYAFAYRFGLTPWEQAGVGGQKQLDQLLDREQSQQSEHDQQDGRPSPGRALDLGCGRGLHSVQLAKRGWEVTGVDFIPRAIAAARRHATTAGLRVTFVEGDVTDLPASVGTGYQFVLDIGCFHGLTTPQRARFGRQVDSVTRPGATWLMLAFSPGGRGPLPRGADRKDLAIALPQWSVTDQVAADTSGMPRPLRSRTPQFYRLRKHG